MNTKAKIISITGISSIVLVALALTFTPARALNYGWGGGGEDEFLATSKITTNVESKNYADVSDETSQVATSGDVVIIHNDDQEGAMGTGRAANTKTSSVSISATTRPMALGASVTTTPEVDLRNVENLESWDDVTLRNVVSTVVENKNDVDVVTSISQVATSGEVKVMCNDDVTGDATSGDAVNTATSSTSITLSN